MGQFSAGPINKVVPNFRISLTRVHGWLRSIVVRTLVSAGELSVLRQTASWMGDHFVVKHPLSVSQHGQLSHPSLKGR